MRGPVLFLSYLSLLWLGVDAIGQEAGGQGAGGPEIVGVRVGLGGRYKPGCWTPVEVTLRGAGAIRKGRLVLTVPDGDGVASRFSTPLPCPADAASTSTHDDETGQDSVLSYARFGRVRSGLLVEIHGEAGLLDRKVFQAGDSDDFPPAILSDQELIVTVGRDSLGVEEAVRLLHQAPEKRSVVVRLEDIGELPAQWFGYEAVDTVVFSTSDPRIYADLTPTSPRIAALDEWVGLGGRLVLCVGQEAETVLRGEPQSALAQFVPGRLKEIVSVRLASAWEIYCGSAARIPVPSGGIRLPHLVDVQGRVEAADGPLPLVIRGARGFGQVVFVAADLDRPPMAEWEDRRLLVAKLLNSPATSTREDDESTVVMHYGFTDLAGQLRSALDQFPGVWLVRFWLVALLIGVYILAIGLGDYFFLRKVVRRMQLTWVTFPVIVVAFSLAAYVLAHRFKGDQVRVNQVDLIDVDVESGQLRGTAWANVFSPRMERYDLSFRPNLPGGPAGREAATLTAWFGLPGRALGGMNPGNVEPEVWNGHYDFSGRLDALAGVPIQIWSTKSFTGRWAARIDAPLEGHLAEQDGLPQGTITNNLDFPLSDCLLAYGGYAYQWEKLEPGESVRVGRNRERRELKSLLTGRKILFNQEKKDYRPQTTPYDQADVDVAYVLQAMMFHEAAGGRDYTELSNRYQGFVDFSHLLKTNRAVLVGRVQADATQQRRHGAELLLDGQPVPQSQRQHTVVYRFVFPVERSEYGLESRVWKAESGE